ncbi:hypothetical protein VC83_04341 [Pseudogymnoascus destructans]|uniref:Uncharacterized protein n=2 Tax=Pseudogymnoascus destructans TaxID=655981 RepID=L8GB94_PSED2|nr:uncharacterized protein VC83_04341 [Pseudogymnoascus destructans]ELR10119.1 hypothetical protein GMDG_04515 [Pseudogymnoascus destructans 20631-21]OAF59085.1 hypothetical protein VC83_04341 [Pseudogymnoascus destructans]
MPRSFGPQSQRRRFTPLAPRRQHSPIDPSLLDTMPSSLENTTKSVEGLSPQNPFDDNGFDSQDDALIGDEDEPTSRGNQSTEKDQGCRPSLR